jgi:hypothetical protein|tara:strand:- start:1495 stop:1623 length:129 start_codon:yes stop_codon:yes gene_type:complete
MIDLKTLSKEQLELVLHNMRIYGVSKEKRQSVIDELNKRHTK